MNTKLTTKTNNTVPSLPREDYTQQTSYVSRLRWDRMRRTSNSIRKAEVSPDSTVALGLRDMFGALYEKSDKLTNPGDVVIELDEAGNVIPEDQKQLHRDAWSSTLDDIRSQDGFDRLLGDTLGDTFISSIVALKLRDSAVNMYVEHVARLLAEKERDKDDEQSGSDSDQEGSSPGDGGQGEGNQSEREGELSEALSEAIKEAQKDATDAAEFGPLAGVGLEENIDTCTDEARALVKAVANSTSTRMIFDMVGRTQSMFKQGDEKSSGVIEPTGVCNTDDIGNVLPQALAEMRSTNKVISFQAAQRIIEGNALGYERSDSVCKKSGPVSIALDNSGSMAQADGQEMSRWDVARAMAIGVIIQAHKDGRKWNVVVFQYGIVWSSVGKSYSETVAHLLRLGVSGGTSISSALSQCYENAIDMGSDTDLLMVTDCCDVMDSNDQTIEKIKNTDINLHLVKIGEDHMYSTQHFDSGSFTGPAEQILSEVSVNHVSIPRFDLEGIDESFSVAANIFKQQ